MIIEEFEVALKLAKDFLATKERENYYGFTAWDEDHCQEDVYPNVLSDEDVANLRALKEKYGKEFVKHLDEVYDDEDVIHDFTCGQEILDIDLDYITHRYQFKIHELKPDGTVFSCPCMVEFRDDDYAKLLACLIYDEDFTMNTLWFYDNSLFNAIMREIYWHFSDEGCPMIKNPYVATPDEAKADADAIVKQHDIKRFFSLGNF